MSLWAESSGWYIFLVGVALYVIDALNWGIQRATANQDNGGIEIVDTLRPIRNIRYVAPLCIVQYSVLLHSLRKTGANLVLLKLCIVASIAVSCMRFRHVAVDVALALDVLSVTGLVIFWCRFRHQRGLPDIASSFSSVVPEPATNVPVGYASQEFPSAVPRPRSPRECDGFPVTKPSIEFPNTAEGQAEP